MKDVFMQSLADIADPSFTTEEKLIVTRVQNLFP